MAVVTGDSKIVGQTSQEEELQEFTISTSRGSINNIPKSNVLHAYRSYTYSFTLSSWQSSSNEVLAVSDNDIILTSSGKAEQTFFKKGLDQTNETDTFNENSPGRFDLYIDNVEMETIPTPSSQNGNTIATRINFEVFEPYSVIGFLEALRASAKSAGFQNYLDAYYRFGISFRGYYDAEDLPLAQDIPPIRTFKIKITNVDIDVDLTGTKYKVSAIPFDEWGFSNVIGSLKFPLQMKGETVNDIAKDLVKQLNENILTEAKKINESITADEVDNFDVSFEIPGASRFIQNSDGSKTEQLNEIGEASIKELAADNAIYTFENINETNKRTAYMQDGNPVETVVYEPGKISVSFSEGAFLHEILSSLARDSTFWTNQIDPESGEITDDFFKFWRIVPEITVGKYSPFHKRETYKVLYKVIVQEMHVSMLPSNRGNSYDPSKLTILRQYNYIYTGANTEILNLKINFNKLFYERVTVGLGNNDRSPAQNSDRPSDSKDITADSKDISKALPGKAAAPGGVPTVETMKQGTVPKNGAGNAINPTTAKSYLAKDYYDSLLSDSVSMIEVDLDIIGDPLWIANEDGELEDAGNSYGYFIKLYFRNGTDIDDTPLDAGGTGLLKFSNSNIQFSGIYMVRQIVSSFKSGFFKQTLKLIRLPFVESGESSASEQLVQNKFGTKPKDGDAHIPSTNEPVPLDKRSSLQNLVSDINQFADSLQSAEERITGAIQGAVAGVTGAIAQAVAVPTQAVARITNSIQGKLQDINDTAVNAADKLGLTTNQLGSLSAKELLTVVALSKLLPDNVNFSQVEQNGIIVPNKDALKTLPPIETKTNESSAVTPSLEQQQAAFEKLTEQFPTDIITRV